MKVKNALLSVFISSLISAPSFSSALNGEMNNGYNLPYLWDSNAGYSNSDWMSAIDNEKKLSEISIPGTHNSMSLYGGDIVQTQTLDILSQLNMGVRYLDARFKYVNGELIAYHGIITQHQSFNSFMSTVSLFLDSNPTETVIIRMQNEAGATTDKEKFYQHFKKVLETYKHNNVIPSSDNPSLGSIRGKFVFIRDFNTFNYKIGIERKSLNIQDKFKLSTNWDLYSKWENVKSHFMSIDANKVSLNYLSGSVGSFPYFVASGKSSPGSHAPQLWTGVSTVDSRKYPDFPRTSCLGKLCSINFAGTNQLTDHWIKSNKFPNALGVVIMDFPGGGIVDTIIQHNSPTKNMMVIYEHANKMGKSMIINNNISSLGEMNNKISSWTIPNGWRVRFYEKENFEGLYYTREHSENETPVFNDTISSIEIIERIN